MTAGSEHRKTGSLEPEEDLGAASALLGFGQAEPPPAGLPGKQPATAKRGRGRPRKPPPATPPEPIKSVRVDMPVDLYIEIKTLSIRENRSPGAILLELATRHVQKMKTNAARARTGFSR